MDNHELHARMAELSRKILSYCMARTSQQQDAEDLAQDILLELVKSVPNLRDDRAFYAFMWSVAGHVYSNWYRRKKQLPVCELPEQLADTGADILVNMEHEESLYLLRRELSLLSARYRRAAVCYYVENMSCAQIASFLHISESMVKHLLFKTRQLLKEGVEMTRNYGEQSYLPKELALLYMGEGPNRFWRLLDGKRIPQNILWACYNDALTEEEISLQLGVALPYLEEEFPPLMEAGLLTRSGRKYSTNLLILSRDAQDEIRRKTNDQVKVIADVVVAFLDENEEELRHIDCIHRLSRNAFRWQTLCQLFRMAAENLTAGDMPITAFGEHAYVWGIEQLYESFGICTLYGNTGDTLLFMDWPSASPGSHKDLYGDQKTVDLFCHIAHGHFSPSNPYEEEILSRLIKNGYVIKDNTGYRTTVIVYTAEQFEQVRALLLSAITAIQPYVEQARGIIRRVLKDHAPVSVRKHVDSIADLHLMHTVTDEPTAHLYADGYLTACREANEMPTISIILKG